MPAAATLNLVGSPILNLTLTGAMDDITFTVTNRVRGKVQLIAEDATGSPVPFLFAATAAGTVGRVLAGAALVLPVLNGQVWWVKEDPTALAATLRVQCVE